MATVKSKLNAAWHKGHLMPERATTAQRIAWHLAHQKHCGCRTIPPKLAELIALQGRTGGATPKRRGRNATA